MVDVRLFQQPPGSNLCGECVINNATQSDLVMSRWTKSSIAKDPMPLCLTTFVKEFQSSGDAAQNLEVMKGDATKEARAVSKLIKKFYQKLKREGPEPVAINHQSKHSSRNYKQSHILSIYNKGIHQKLFPTKPQETCASTKVLHRTSQSNFSTIYGSSHYSWDGTLMQPQ